MIKPLQPHLLKRVPPACKGERTMRWRGRPPIGGQDNDGVSLLCSALYTLLPLRGISPQGETRNLRRKTESHILHVPLRNSPFGGWRHHLARWEVCHWIRGSPTAPLWIQFPCHLKGKREVWRGKTENHIFHVPFRSFPPLAVNAVSQSPECVSCHMAQKVNSRNADFILIALRAIPQPSARKAVKPKNPWAEGPSILRTLTPQVCPRPVHLKNPFPQPFYTTRRRQAAITLGAFSLLLTVWLSVL